MSDKKNPMAGALSSGVDRRRSSGERAGGGAPEDEKLLTVSLPLSLHSELKSTGGRVGQTMKEIVTRAIRTELQKLDRQ
jgi:hypothetical protein